MQSYRKMNKDLHVDFSLEKAYNCIHKDQSLSLKDFHVIKDIKDRQKCN
jgi:hypothetical protein